MNRICSSILGFLWIAASLHATDLTAAELTDASFAELHQSLIPKTNERWRTIPWKISLIEAQHAAVDEDKPIFIWAMDGHPLGCT